ncbi:TPA: DUF1642 domain-containing protein [Streptococcus suis]
MNKQEAIEKIYTASWDAPDYEGLVVKVETVNEIISQIDEPPKVVLPKFVAEWLESVKSVGWLFKVALNNPTDSVGEWLANRDNQEIFARAWLDGFEIKQEKLYTVEIPNPNATHNDVYILGRTLSGDISIWRINRDSDIKNYDSDFQLTESEIKQDFEWAWDAGFAEEVDELK